MRNQINNVPSLRFKDFSGEWKYKKLGDYISERNDFSTEDLPLYSLTIAEGIVPKSERYEREFLVNDVSEAYKVMYLNDFAYNPMNLRFGALARHKGNIKVAVSKYYNIFYCNEDANSIFMEYYLTSNKLIQYYDKMSTGSLIEKKRVHYSDFVNFVRLLPSLPEQQKIASFLTTVDDKLQALKKKKTLLEQYKKGVMQKIFSQERRFKDDNGKDFPEWETSTLGDCLNYEQPTEYLVTNTEYDDTYETPVLTAGKTFILGYTNETYGVFNKVLPVIIFDDFTTAIQFVSFPFKAKSSAMKILIANNGFDIKFLYEAMKMIKYDIGGHERHWISKFSQLEIQRPSFPEQTKIANFLTAIDDKINHCQTQIEKTEMWKKGLLQRMFC